MVLLPEDLTASFARAVGRGGVATSHIKRYVVDRVYHKSTVGGHPRETLEASFDVIQEGVTKGLQLEAETIMVASQVMGTIPMQDWFLRLGHTKLADGVLELCGVPAKESLRKLCLYLLSRFTAPTPTSVFNLLPQEKKAMCRNRTVLSKADRLQELDTLLKEAVSNQGLLEEAGKKLRVFIQCCFPLPPDLSGAVDVLKKAIAKIRSLDVAEADPRRMKRFEDCAKRYVRLYAFCLDFQPFSVGSISIYPCTIRQSQKHSRLR